MLREAGVGFERYLAKHHIKVITASHWYIKFKTPEELPKVTADRVRMERIIYNLIDNSIKYSPEGGDITFFAYQGDDCLVMGVKD